MHPQGMVSEDGDLRAVPWSYGAIGSLTGPNDGSPSAGATPVGRGARDAGAKAKRGPDLPTLLREVGGRNFYGLTFLRCATPAIKPRPARNRT